MLVTDILFPQSKTYKIGENKYDHSVLVLTICECLQVERSAA
jgi:hypothetical protein